jgi:hypothetical protein
MGEFYGKNLKPILPKRLFSKLMKFSNYQYAGLTAGVRRRAVAGRLAEGKY